ncbi:MAG: C39 family peptidase [Candidatus Moranbacteria bacterium]|nr:C39 family peptidase [Candidatus Moranbacteria bacterium]
MNKRKVFFGILLLAAILFAGLFFRRVNFEQKEKQDTGDQVQILPEEKNVQDENEKKSQLIENQEEKQTQIKQVENNKVPFTSQAPLGDWSDPRNQNGCEEASVAMAMRWIDGKSFSSPNDAQQEIFDIAKFEEKTFGYFIDTDVSDVGKILVDFYDFKNFTISKSFILDDLKKELAKQNIILVPVYGRALKNPNFTQPGPITHMLVIVGWDAKTKEFITNDPGTKRGENYRYDEKVLFDAIWAYPSGKNHPDAPKSIKDKAMLVISRS